MGTYVIQAFIKYSVCGVWALCREKELIILFREAPDKWKTPNKVSYGDDRRDLLNDFFVYA